MTVITIEEAQKIIDVARHCKVLGLRVTDIADNQLTIELPYSNALVGNPINGVIHGGALTTLLDTACGFSIPLSLDSFQLCPTLDLRIDYMTAAKPGMNVLGRAEVYRVTQNIVFAKGIAYQDDDSKPIAHCVATFARLSKDITSPPTPDPVMPGPDSSLTQD